jgi:ABC-type bacteriocin/lantibiotic exporter with double-glycine peptidase domain
MLWGAARTAAFDTDIESMPMGMHTPISEGGGSLSGGQGQHLLMADELSRQDGLLARLIARQLM